MQSAADLAQRLKVLSLYKNLYKNIRLTQPGTTSSSDSTNNSQKHNHSMLRSEFRQNMLSDSRYCMEKNEMFFLGNAYLCYIKSTRATLDLYAKYCKGERSIEASANLVGLKLPKLYQESESGGNSTSGGSGSNPK